MLSDDDLAMILGGKAKKLEDGNKSREEITRELAQLVADDLRERNDGFVNKGRLQSQGRASFGRSNEGREGLALFIPEEW